MPFFKTYEVPKGFFGLFLKETNNKSIPGDNREHPMLTIPIHTGENSDFMVRYYKRSGDRPIEDVMEYYPCVVIQDFQPEIDKAQLWGKDYVEGIVDTARGMRELITLPIPVMYRFQVSVVTNRLKHVQSANDWFFDTFSFNKPSFFEFNTIDTEEGVVCDVVPYTAQFGEIPREDRRFEYVFDFTLNTYIHAKAKPYNFVDTQEGNNIEGGTFKDMVEKISVALTTKNYAQFKKEITDNFFVEDELLV